MAAIFILLGSVLGFIAAVVCYVGFDLGLVLSLSIWAASGPLSVLVLVAATLRPQPVRNADKPRAFAKAT